MSLAGDFNMYYQGTVIYVEQGGVRYPFLINSVDGRESLSSLRFYGNLIIDADGRTRGADFNYDDLDFTLPEIGYRMVNGTPRWITYKTMKTVRKGLHPIRLANFNDHDFSRPNIWQLSQTFPGRISDDWCQIEDALMFKGFQVGTVSGRDVTLSREAEYLQGRLEQLRPDFNITVAA